jgi:cell division protein FtsZ
MQNSIDKPPIAEMRPRLAVLGVGGGGGNAVNNMIAAGLQGTEFIVANTDAQALSMSNASRIVQLGVNVTEGLGAGSQPAWVAVRARALLRSSRGRPVKRGSLRWRW